MSLLREPVMNMSTAAQHSESVSVSTFLSLLFPLLRTGFGFVLQED